MNPIIYYLFFKIARDPYIIQWSYHVKMKDEITKNNSKYIFQKF
jgi:hypothetical protein